METLMRMFRWAEISKRSCMCRFTLMKTLLPPVAAGGSRWQAGGRPVAAGGKPVVGRCQLVPRWCQLVPSWCQPVPTGAVLVPSWCRNGANWCQTGAKLGQPEAAGIKMMYEWSISPGI
jgi:hypothetical protein